MVRTVLVLVLLTFISTSSAATDVMNDDGAIGPGESLIPVYLLLLLNDSGGVARFDSATFSTNYTFGD